MLEHRNRKKWFHFSFAGFRRSAFALCLFTLAACSHNGNRALDAENRFFYREFGLLDEVGKTLLICRPTPEGFTFGVRFNVLPSKKCLAEPQASRQLPTVEYWYSVWDGLMYLDKTVYLDSGAGLPRNPQPGETMTMENGSIVFSGHQRRGHYFRVWVDRNYDHLVFLPSSCGAGPEISLQTLLAREKRYSSGIRDAKTRNAFETLERLERCSPIDRPVDFALLPLPHHRKP